MTKLIESITAKDKRLAVGIMSGTSFDGVDVAFCEITGHGPGTKVRLLHFDTKAYSSANRAALLMNSSAETSNVADICRLNKQLGVLIGGAVLEIAESGGISMDDVDFIASHGQTMFHMPDIGATLQIGEPADIAAITNKPVVADFRPSDMAYGGQGAPLVPFTDYILYRDENLNRVTFNIGGIGNVTILPKGCDMDAVRAFDTGPGNVNIDNLMRLHTKGEENFDYNGNMASTGKQNMEFCEYLADADPFLTIRPPKSTGREFYTISFAEKLLRRAQEFGIPFPDVLASVTNHTAYALWYALTYFNNTPVDEILVTGGGARNKYLMGCIEALFPGKVKKLDNFKTSDAKEAVAFAILGNEFLHGGANNMPLSTGAKRAVIMGKLTLPSGGTV
ncbi:MAG: anhydro-N-acetylmuramic acid kinase [Clostridiales bacterium]|jgi:anhydro-N-acetylmuramic acid kinase|nr:anhydro-N-acetylmuramic acid kinase [Clostridiales bacterium]